MIFEENKIVQSLWIDGNLTNNELLSLKSYIYCGHDFHLYTYAKNIKDVPKEIILKDANEIIPQSKVFKDSAGSLAAFSDWFRFKLLYGKGGWWVDLDTVCLQPLHISGKFCFSTERDSLGNILPNATCIKSVKKALLFKECLDFIEQRNTKDVLFGEFGLSLYRKKLKRYELVDFIKPPVCFCPINWFNVYQLISLSAYKPSDQTFTIHLWNDMWRRGRLNKNATYHPESIYERLKKKYLYDRT